MKAFDNKKTTIVFIVQLHHDITNGYHTHHITFIKDLLWDSFYADIIHLCLVQKCDGITRKKRINMTWIKWFWKSIFFNSKMWQPWRKYFVSWLHFLFNYFGSHILSAIHVCIYICIFLWPNKNTEWMYWLEDQLK